MEIRISDRKIGENQPVFIVAEMSANHLQKFDNAVKLIRVAKEAGADAIKLQTYTPDTMTLNVDSEYFRLKKNSLYYGKTMYQVYQEAYTPWEWQPKLKEIAEEEDLICFSSVFDKTSVDFLEKINVPCYKISSLEIADIPLIEYAASKDKPIIISTGIAMLSDIEEAINVCKKVGNTQIALLKCVSAYPTPLGEINLRTIPNLAETFRTLTGLSDHTLTISIPIASVAFGACIIEKHLTLNRSLGGPDAKFSLEPIEFKTMVSGIREVEQSLGESTHELTGGMRKERKYRRSLFVVEDIEANDTFTEDNVKPIRPGQGLKPKHISSVLGKRAKRAIKRGIPLTWELVK